VIAAAAGGPAAATLYAHPGPRVWIGSENGTLVTYRSNNDLAPTSYTPDKLFVGGADEDSLQANGLLAEYPVPGTNIFATEYPGYQVRLDQPGSAVNFGTTIGFEIAGPLLVFDPVRMVYRTSIQLFGTPTPQLGVSAPGGSGETVVTGSASIDGFDFFSYNSASDHAHLVATMLPNGVVPPPPNPPGDGPHAVYAVPLRLTASGYTKSLPFVVLYGRGIVFPDDADFVAAKQVAATSFGFPGDANLDGIVDITDLGILATHWQTTGFWTDGDFTNDGLVDISDLGILATNWQLGLSSARAVPEPAAMLVAGVCQLFAARLIPGASGSRRTRRPVNASSRP
jgi:hypothetical protein